MEKIMEFGFVDEVAKMVGITEKEVVDIISAGKIGLVYNKDFRWAEVSKKEQYYSMILHLENCANAIKRYLGN